MKIIVFLLVLFIFNYSFSDKHIDTKLGASKLEKRKLVKEKLKKYKNLEIKEYKGKKLDSFIDHRENSIKGPQYLNKNKYFLEVAGLVKNIKRFKYDELRKFESLKKVITLNCVEGWSSTILWEGFYFKDLLKETGIDYRAKNVIFYAYDGYTTSLELDYLLKNDIILAFKMNGVELPPERGFPLQLVAESKWGYKWIKWITKIELVSNLDYEGYWEKTGYSIDGDLDKKFWADDMDEFYIK